MYNLKDKLNIWNFFTLKYRFSFLLILVVLILGIVSAVQIPKESNPEVDIPYVVVNVPFPGANAKNVEELVTNIIEDKLLNLEGVKEVTSTSGEGFSNITIEFNPEEKDRDLKVEVENKVDEAALDLPEESKDPIVKKIEMTDQSVFDFSLSGDYKTVQLKNFADDIKKEIEKIPRVSNVEIIGGEKREIKVIVNKALLDGYGLGISQVTSAISRANTDIPTGSIKTGGFEYTVRLAGRITEPETIKKVPVAVRGDNSVVLVEDVARVIDDYKEKTAISRLSVDGGRPLPAVSVRVFKSQGGNIIEVADKVSQIIDDSQKSILPKDINVEVTTDMADYVRNDLNNLFINGLQTIVLIFILLCFFVGIREALIASFAVPLSFVITFIFLPVFDLTINFLSLFSLILALGILIDTAVVITERMNVYIEKDYSASDSALKTIEEFKWPLLVGTLTTIFAFLPMLLMSGILGEYVRVIPITVTIVLVSSLFVGLAIVPSLGSRFLRKKKGDENINKRVSRVKSWCYIVRDFVGNKIFGYAVNRYRFLLKTLLDKKSYKIILVSVLILLFGFSLALPITGILKVNMFPAEDAELFWVDIKRPRGTSLEKTSETVSEIENFLVKEEDIKSFSSNIGSSIMSGSGEHLAGVVVNLKEDKQKDSREIVKNFQNIFNESIEAEVNIFQFGGGPPSFAPIDIAIRGDSLDELENLTLRIENIAKKIPGATNVQSTVEESQGEFVFKIDRSKSQLYGISTLEVAQILRNAVSGSDATTLRKEGEEAKVVVKYDLENESNQKKVTINSLESLTIATPRGSVPLSSFVETELTGVRPFIKHESGKRTYRVTANTQPGVAPIEVIQPLQKKVSALNLPQDYEVNFGGEQEDINQSYNDMFKAMILAIFLIASILVLQFDSFRQPIFILVSIPLAFIGVFPGLALMGKDFSFPAIIGVVALAGVVVNNGIILVDMINRNRKEKDMDIKEAVVSAGITRFRPIILTTITTIVGVLPITLSSELWGALGYTLIFGLLVSAGLTLFMVPLLYNRFAEKSF